MSCVSFSGFSSEDEGLAEGRGAGAAYVGAASRGAAACRSCRSLNKVPVKPASFPSLARNSTQATAAPVPSTSSGRIIPAHSHLDYNRRDFSRSAVPGSVINLKVTY